MQFSSLAVLSLVCAALVLPLNTAALSAADAIPKESAALAAMREKAKHRHRGLIYNDDSGDVMEKGADTPEGFLSKRLQPILGTQVESVFYCTGATTMFTHLAKVGETYGEFIRDDSEPMAVLTRDNIKALAAAGHDTLELATRFCHDHKLEIFFTWRINDIHDTFMDWELTRWKREHPQYLLGKAKLADPDYDAPRHWWSALDFDKPEVRDYLYRIMEDVCARYDVDGVEIDYFRSPMFFRPNLDFKPATAAQVAVLTEFQQRLRDIAYAAGAKRGRPILMGVRVPATPETCRHVGIDIKRWLDDDLTDIMTVGGGYVPFTEPMAEMVRLARAHRVPIYSTISASGMRGQDNRYSSVEAWRGAAANMWRAGAQGICAFNIFPSGPEPRFMEIGSRKTLAALNKVFAIDNKAILEGDLVQGIEQRQILPVAIPGDGTEVATTLPIGDNIRTAARKQTLKSAAMLVQLSEPAALDVIEVRLNGKPLKPSRVDREKCWLTFEPSPSAYRTGDNRVSFRATTPTADGKSAAQVLVVEVQVSYK